MGRENEQDPRDKQPKAPFPPQQLDRPGIEGDLDPRPRYRGAEYKASGKLAGKAALITGGDSGIGRSVAVLYAREGCDVAIVHLPEEREDAEETLAAVRSVGCKGISIPGDVQDFAFCQKAVETTVKEFGHLDILVNNAAFQNHVDKIEDLTIEQWHTTFHTNIDGYFYMVKAAIEHLKPGSVVINSGSITGLEGSPGLLDYSATKGAIHAFTKSLAKSLVERGIRVNCVAPGPVWTPLNPAERSAEEIAKFGQNTPYERPAQPEEVAPAYVFFASNADSSYITGEVLTLLGGDVRAA